MELAINYFLQVYYDLEEYENCISDFTLGLEKKLSPQQSYQSHFYRGIAHRKINELQKSVESLKGCLEIDATKIREGELRGKEQISVTGTFLKFRWAHLLGLADRLRHLWAKWI